MVKVKLVTDENYKYSDEQENNIKDNINMTHVSFGKHKANYYGDENSPKAASVSFNKSTLLL